MNNIVVIGKQNTTSILKLSILLLSVFVGITILVYNIYKGNKVILPNLQEELRENSNFYLLKSLAWSFLITLLLAWVFLSDNKKTNGKYAVNKVVKI